MIILKMRASLFLFKNKNFSFHNLKATKLTFLYFYLPLVGQENLNNFSWQIGEELSYKVSWGFIPVGTLNLSILDTMQIDVQKTYHVRLNIDSNPWLFFVNMHSTFDGYLLNNTFPRRLVVQEEIDGMNYKSRYDFDYTNNIINSHYESIEDTSVNIDTGKVMDKKYQDGMSIIYYARANCHKNNQEQLNLFYEAKEGLLDINFTGQVDSIETDFSETKIPAFYLNGEAHFKAIAGFTGKYEGWFSNDKQRIPLAARMEVFLGSVYLELEKKK
ncbi:MAG: DUF3108 domain-containing protein [Calditrichaeota bacterium]|nr:MAG: DUF3108 domain-containing protein [Calditrichota bacterium]MBL1208017.1 DUF3108 domain-containing protein [Calditrichota bacterium]NOG47853.1 DUF3108 domain-containing protein [Calditrichota bacterium]